MRPEIGQAVTDTWREASTLESDIHRSRAEVRHRHRKGQVVFPGARRFCKAGRGGGSSKTEDRQGVGAGLRNGFDAK